MTEEQFDKLREHLELVKPIVDGFCASSGYRHVDPRSIGRYPRIRIEKPGKVTRWLDLWMELDNNENRYESFFEDVPYELGAGANYDLEDGTQYGCRFQKSYAVFSGKPFRLLPETLLGDLHKGAIEIEKWTAELLEDQGNKVNLG